MSGRSATTSGFIISPTRRRGTITHLHEPEGQVLRTLPASTAPGRLDAGSKIHAVGAIHVPTSAPRSRAAGARETRSGSPASAGAQPVCIQVRHGPAGRATGGGAPPPPPPPRRPPPTAPPTS